MSKADGGPAFPVINATDFLESDSGMSLRDYLAARAFERLVQCHIDGNISDMGKVDIAVEAYSYADAMITERNR